MKTQTTTKQLVDGIVHSIIKDKPLLMRARRWLDENGEPSGSFADELLKDFRESFRVQKSAHVPEYGWLIEATHLGSPHWWNGQHFDDDCWTNDSLEAIRYARKEDAEKIIKHFEWTAVIATEHQWG